MTRTFGRLASAALAAALLLAAPAAARAGCTVKTSDVDGNGSVDFQVFGTNVSNENITVNVGPTSTAITGCGAKTYNTQFGSYFFKPNGGQDSVTFNVVGTWVGLHKNVMIQCAIGNCKATIGGTGALTAGSSLIAEINGMSTVDTIAVVVPAMNGSYLDVRTNLGPGNDGLIVKLDNPVTGGSVVNVDADLMGDVNTYKLSQTALNDGTVNLHVVGGIKNDSGTLTLGGPVGPNGRLVTRVDLGYGGDSFDGQVSLPFFSIAPGGEVHVDVFGNGNDDVLLFSRKGSLGGPSTLNEGLLDVFLDGGSENDAVGVDVAGAGFILDGTTRLRLSGGSGNDTLNASIDVQSASATPRLDVLLYGGSGTDKLTTTINDNGPNGPGNYGPAGTVLLDGGTDAGDNCTANGNGIVHERNCES